MNRRQFSKSLITSSFAVSFYPASLAIETKPQIAITMDDFALANLSEEAALRRTRAVLRALRSHGDIKAAGFICGSRVDNEIGKKVLSEWNQANHILANHTYSHWYYPNKTVAEFSADILRAEALLKGYSQYRKLFRFPYLKEGDTVERRDQLRSFLKDHGYRMGYVTIDASDWYVDQRLRAKLEKDSNANLASYKKFYLEHIWDRAQYYNELSQKVLNRSVKHTLLIHFNLVNELFLDDLLTMFTQKGWQLINADTAFQDPVFSSQPKTLPAGESIIWALAKESGKFDHLLRYPAEDGEYEKPKMDKLGL